ncbi:unnamed protein product, partial [Oikopleura dioica]
LFRALLTLET